MKKCTIFGFCYYTDKVCWKVKKKFHDCMYQGSLEPVAIQLEHLYRQWCFPCYFHHEFIINAYYELLFSCVYIYSNSLSEMDNGLFISTLQHKSVHVEGLWSCIKGSTAYRTWMWNMNACWCPWRKFVAIDCVSYRTLTQTDSLAS